MSTETWIKIAIAGEIALLWAAIYNFFITGTTLYGIIALVTFAVLGAVLYFAVRADNATPPSPVKQPAPINLRRMARR